MRNCIFKSCLLAAATFLLCTLLFQSAAAMQSVSHPSGRDNETTAHLRQHFWAPQPLFKKHHNVKSPWPHPMNDYDFTDEDAATWGSFEAHPCRRLCQPGRKLTCYYRIAVHNYQFMGPECVRCQKDPQYCESDDCIFGDGVPTPIMAINRRLPGPPIEVCENDTIIVDVLNQLSEPTTIHWHGLHMSHTPEMDGAPYVTQYPLQPGEVYRYAFPVDRYGTNWYHSHVGWQRAFGVAAPLIIRQIRAYNPHASLYDFDLIEHTLMLHDIIYDYDVSGPANILINGKGRNHLTDLPDNDARHRYERLRVTPGQRYRFRVIFNGVFECPVEVSVENHRILIISTDGNDIVPVAADSFFMSSAERFDFVLEANQYPTNYWLRVRGYGVCATRNLYQGAVLHYKGSQRHALPIASINMALYGRQTGERGESRVVVNTMMETMAAPANSSERCVKEVGASSSSSQTTNIATVQLRSLWPFSWPRDTNFLTYYSSFGSRKTPKGEPAFQIDDITYEEPSVSLLQAHNLYDEERYLCNRSALADAGRDCKTEYCECTNVIRLPAYRPIEMIIVNYKDSTHPFHTHGYTFRVVGQAVIGNVDDLRRIHELDQKGYLRRVPYDYPAVQKDTIQVPGRGYIIVRFISDNPGYWMYHCHIEQHAVYGMVAVLKVGEYHQMKHIPRRIHC